MDLPAFVSRTIRSRPKGDLASDEDNSASIFCALERKKERELYTIVNLQLHAVEKNFSRRDLHCWIFFSFLLFFFFLFFYFFESRSTERRYNSRRIVDSRHDRRPACHGAICPKWFRIATEGGGGTVHGVDRINDIFT